MTGTEGSETNFASAVMMRLVAAGLEKQGLGHLLKPAKGAHVPRDSKRSFLLRLRRDHGLESLLRLADAVPEMPPEPVVLALRKAADMEDLFSRWHRVETFSHASHTVDVQSLRPGHWVMDHRSRHVGERPTEEESLLVIAVLTRLGELTTGARLTLRTGSGAPLRENGEWSVPVPSKIKGPFSLSGGTLADVGGFSSDKQQEDLVPATKALMARDVTRRWTIDDVARAMGQSKRSLQRKYSVHGTSFSTLVSEVRLEAAASYLCGAERRSLAEIGFLTGFSDQAHFSRAFAQNVGTTPRAYQASFAP